MTVKEIVKKFAEEHGYDGLINDECGCDIVNDFAPCGQCIDNCELAYVCPCKECDDGTKENCHAYIHSEGFDFLVLPEKCEKRIELEAVK